MGFLLPIVAGSSPVSAIISFSISSLVNDETVFELISIIYSKSTLQTDPYIFLSQISVSG